MIIVSTVSFHIIYPGTVALNLGKLDKSYNRKIFWFQKILYACFRSLFRYIFCFVVSSFKLSNLKMSNWFNTKSFTNIATTALKTAQKRTDKVLDIREEQGVPHD